MLFDQLESTTGSAYVLIDSGRLNHPRWITSRLCIVAIMLRKVKRRPGLRFIDFTGYGGMETSDLARLRQLQDENRRKDRIIARMALEIDAMKELVEKNA